MKTWKGDIAGTIGGPRKKEKTEKGSVYCGLVPVMYFLFLVLLWERGRRKEGADESSLSAFESNSKTAILAQEKEERHTANETRRAAPMAGATSKRERDDVSTGLLTAGLNSAVGYQHI